MKKQALIRRLRQAAPVFEELEWLDEVVVFGPAARSERIDFDVDVLLIAGRTLSTREHRETTRQVLPRLEDRIQRSLDVRITTARALESPRSSGVGHGRVFREETVSVFRRDTNNDRAG